MLTDKEKFKDIILAIAREIKFRPLIVEKDYYLTIILNNVETLLTNKIVFKGGTLLNKAYLNYHRLSEDLDFTYHVPLSARKQRSQAIADIRAKMPHFLQVLNLASDQPDGEGFNNSMQYVFKIKYQSVLIPKDGIVKLEISFRQPPIDPPVYTEIRHFYKDPFTGEDLVPQKKVWSLSLNEAVAEKLKAAIARKDAAIRDYYDLWHIAELGFDFYDETFIKLFKRKIAGEGYAGDYRKNFGLSADKASRLRRQVDTDLMPVIRSGENFDLDKVFTFFNGILDKF